MQVRTLYTAEFPKGQFWGPFLFWCLYHGLLNIKLAHVYINDLVLGLSSKVSKFTGDTKLGNDAGDPESVRALQREPELLEIGLSSAWRLSLCIPVIREFI